VCLRAQARVPHRSTGAEIHEHDAAVLAQHDVLRFDIAMEQPGSVNCGQRIAEGDANRGHARRREGAIPLEVVPKSAAAHQFHPDPGAAIDACGPQIQ
jgi:hypothetical protein